jgi:hypothetical protein
MPTADATLLPAPAGQFSSSSSAEERGSERRLDDVGVETVLEAMVAAKKRASQPCQHEVEADDGDADETTPRGRPPVVSEVFLKAR